MRRLPESYTLLKTRKSELARPATPDGDGERKFWKEILRKTGALTGVTQICVKFKHQNYTH
jgi:hypothetical protein